jgi:curved DNA-binding protein CbpA
MADLYNILGVKKNAKSGGIKRAYRKKAGESHPDRGGEAEQFNLVKLAYDVLSDDERRERYDKGGSRRKMATTRRSWSR